jgi:hypothetical protein
MSAALHILTGRRIDRASNARGSADDGGAAAAVDDPTKWTLERRICGSSRGPDRIFLV